MEEFLKSIGGLDRIIYSAINIAVGVLIYVIIRTVVSSWARRSEKRFQDRSRDFATVRTVVVTTSRVIILIAVVLSILAIYGVDVVAPLAGLGIGAVIIGLALQDAAKDIIGGILILADGKYKVGDTIQLDEETRGKVVFLSLRTTKIRSFTGKVVVIPNRNIATITNLTAASFSLAQVKVKVAYEEDSAKVEKVLNEIKTKMDHSMPEMSEDGEIEILDPERKRSCDEPEKLFSLTAYQGSLRYAVPTQDFSRVKMSGNSGIGPTFDDYFSDKQDQVVRPMILMMKCQLN